MMRFSIIAGFHYGVFANLFAILRQLRIAELEERIPIIYWIGGMYRQKGGYNNKKGPNIWEYFFERVSEYSPSMFEIKEKNYGACAIRASDGTSVDITTDEKIVPIKAKFYDSIGCKEVKVKIVRGMPKKISEEPAGCWDYGIPPKTCMHNPDTAIRSYVNGLLNKYVKIRPIVQEKVDAFYEENMKGFHVLGIHRRAGPDFKAGHGQTTRFNRKIKKYISLVPDTKILIASDTHVEIDHVKSKFGNRVICYDSLRAEKGRWLFNAKNRRWIDSRVRKKQQLIGAKPAEEVLIEAILLSKCNYLYHGISNVSAAASCFNPQLPIRFIPKYSEQEKKEMGL